MSSDRIVMRRRRASQPATGRPVTCRRKLAEVDPSPGDPFSALPDDLLREIILLLPIKDGGRAQVLSSRWRRLWGSVPLSLDCCDLVGVRTVRSYRKDACTVVPPILSAHPGPVRRLCARSLRLYDGNTEDAWLRSAALDSLEELELVCKTPRPPTSIFRFSNTLRVVSIAGCDLPDDEILQGLHFPRLKQLGLERVSVSERALHGLIATCPVLEFLLLHTTSGFRSLRINSLSLARLSVYVDPKAYAAKIQFDEIVIENAPRLERLIYLFSVWGLDVSVYFAPKVENLDFLTNLQNFAKKLVSASGVIQESPVHSPTTAVHIVKSLSVNMYLSLDKVVDLMRLFPCLDKLHIKSHKSDPENWRRKNFWRLKHRKFIRYHDIRVKTLVLEPYLGTLSHVNFATFFVLNARQLELMTFQIQADVYNEGFLAQQYRKLQLDNKVSRDARFHFTTTSCQRDCLSTKHLRDFDLNDPFLGGC